MELDWGVFFSVLIAVVIGGTLSDIVGSIAVEYITARRNDRAGKVELK